MKKLWIPALAILLLLGACGAEKTQVKEAESKQGEATTTSEIKDTSVQIASLVDPRLQEPKEDTVCEMCNMKVYMKDHEMGMFSTQAIKEDGTVTFYDDIGCLLNAEVANEEKNEKFVRDYNTKAWAKVEDVTIVKTELKSPMNWGYIYFSEKADADKYIAENPKAYVEELHKIKEDALERRKKKMQEKEANGDVESMQMEEMSQEQGHDNNH
ncbi:nitrous oxide reductase accessory protein NosL [Lysinibacillus sp. NPDC048646]|uniref:nitrous oxide reductase accessory protein NosL n=1 Tax=Lysinibacillus sp. NPDC048646 TaxID=3390574 RepID=UPI00117F3C53|nr:hypothetical protein FOH38_07045 [Lysinibacillus fusiformis]